MEQKNTQTYDFQNYKNEIMNELYYIQKAKQEEVQNIEFLSENTNEDIIERALHFDASVHRFDTLSDK